MNQGSQPTVTQANWAEEAVAEHVGAEHLSREEQVLERIDRARRRKARIKEPRITMSHGAGGKASRTLTEAIFLDALDNPVLAELEDAASLTVGTAKLAFTTDSFVVSPLFFPGGDIGELAVNGTVNDLAMMGARPLHLTAAFVVEEGFPTAELRRIAASMGAAASAAGVGVIAGDTKVVERGSGDGVYISTAGVGVLERAHELSPTNVRPGDKVLVSGTLGDHGMAVMIARGSLELEVDLESDTAPLHEMVDDLLSATEGVRCLRDLTRGGLATALNEIALAADVGIVLDEARLPVRPEVNGACEILGIDPLYVANEGKLLAIVASEAAGAAVEALASHRLGIDTVVVGEVHEEPAGLVLLDTAFGGRRVLDMLVGDPLPRIC